MQLCEKINYEFKDPDLLDLALSHSSWSHEQSFENPLLMCNERLEFLGDAVLELVTSRYLYHTCDQAPEGELSRLRSSLVNTQSLAGFARALGLGEYLNLGKGEEHQDGRHKVSILADTLEAVLAAIFLDGGLIAVQQVILKMIHDHAAEVGGEHVDHKSILQEKIQAIMPSHPQYKLLSSTGPDHQKCFQVAVVLKGKTLATAEGRTKKQAEQEAARIVLENPEIIQGEE